MKRPVAVLLHSPICVDSDIRTHVANSACAKLLSMPFHAVGWQTTSQRSETAQSLSLVFLRVVLFDTR